MGLIKSVKVSAFGIRVLKKMSEGGLLINSRGDGYKVKGLSVPFSLINEFKKKDLIFAQKNTLESKAPPQLLISDVGKVFLRRHLGFSKKKGYVKSGSVKKIMGSKAGINEFSSQHKVIEKQIIIQKGGEKEAFINRAENPLGWLAGRRDSEGNTFLSSDHLVAADRLRLDFEMAGLNPRITSSLDELPFSGKRKGEGGYLLPMEHQLMARTRYRQAIDALGPGLADVLVRVCCYLEGLTETEKHFGWPSRSAKLVLKIALDRLISHYAKR